MSLIALLAHAAPTMAPGAPPFAFMMGGIAGILVMATLGIALVPWPARATSLGLAWLLLVVSCGTDRPQTSDTSEPRPEPPASPPLHAADELVAAATDVVGFLQGHVPFARLRLADTVTLQLSREGGGRPRKVARERLRDPSSWNVRSDELPHMMHSFVPPKRLTVLTTRVGRHLKCMDYDLSSVAPELAALPHVGTMLTPIAAEYATCMNTWNLTLVFHPGIRPPTLVAAVYDQWEW